MVKEASQPVQKTKVKPDLFKKKKVISKTPNHANKASNVDNLQIFVSGIPYETTQDEIREIFEECGNVTNIKLPRYQDTGRCRGYAHVRFDNNQSVESALLKDNMTIGERYLTIKKAVGQKPVDHSNQVVPIGCKTLFVKNLPYEITEQEIKKVFMHCGKIDTIRMVYDSFHKHFKGFCYIDFKEPSSLKAGLKMNGSEHDGRKLVTQFAVTNAKKGYKGYKREE